MSSVQEVLTNKKVYFVEKGKDILISCLNPEHEDSNPSQRVDIATGRFHCLSCGHKGNIFSYFNVDRNPNHSRTLRLKEKITTIRREATGLPMPSLAIPYETSWRGISAETLKRFHAFEDVKEFPDRIAFPILDITGRITCFNARYLFSDASPKYIIKPADFKPGLYPPKVDMINDSIVLVEGLFDMLNTQDKGLVNSVSIFGTQKLNEHNIVKELTPYILQGCRKVWVMLDSDESGKKACTRLIDLIHAKTDLEAEEISLGAGSDPGELSKYQVDTIVSYISK